MPPTAAPQLLDAYPLVRSRSVADASERIGRIFSRHRLALRQGELDVRHNQLRLHEVSLNVLRYGAEVSIDPGERGDFYLVQLPLAGHAQLASGGQQVHVDADVLSVLQPQARSHMVWSGDCTMLLVQVPRPVVDRRAADSGLGVAPRFALTRSRRDPAVAAWWQAVLDLTHNLDRFGAQWLQHPAAAAAMSEFLLSAFTSLLCEPAAAAAAPVKPLRGDARCLQRAKEFVQAHTDRALTLAEIARHACVGPRTLEAVFQRQGEGSPMAYARRCRLQAAHRMLQAAAREGRPLSVTDVALAHGFLHMGRFAAQYRAAFGCAPSDTLRWH